MTEFLCTYVNLKKKIKMCHLKIVYALITLYYFTHKIDFFFITNVLEHIDRKTIFQFGLRNIY